MSTFKRKVGLGALIATLLVTVLLYVLVIFPWANDVAKEARSDLQRAAGLIQQIQRLHAYDLVATAKEIALREDVMRSVQELEEPRRRRQVFDAITAFDRKLREQGRKADFLAIIDAQGKVIARDLNIEDMYNERLPFA